MFDLKEPQEQNPRPLVVRGPQFEKRWYRLLPLGYKLVQHVIVLNTVGNCNTKVNIILKYII